MLLSRFRRKKVKDEEPDEPEPTVKAEKPKASWRWFIPIVGLIALVWFVTRTPIYIAALVVGTVASWYYGSKMTLKDSRPVLRVDLEAKTIRFLWVGRARWERMTKIGTPVLNLETPGGNTIDVVKDIDMDTDTVTYYSKEEYTDLHFLTEPGKLAELVNKFAKVENENMGLTTTMEIKSLERAREHIANYSEMVDRVLGWNAPEEKKEAKKS